MFNTKKNVQYSLFFEKKTILIFTINETQEKLYLNINFFKLNKFFKNIQWFLIIAKHVIYICTYVLFMQRFENYFNNNQINLSRKNKYK